jgi:hypothetical protein
VDSHDDRRRNKSVRKGRKEIKVGKGEETEKRGRGMKTTKEIVFTEKLRVCDVINLHIIQKE